MTDIVERLRALVILDEVRSDNPLGREAADEIERLREALKLTVGDLLVLVEEINRELRAAQTTLGTSHD